MSDLGRRAFTGTATFLTVLAILLFASAGTVTFWQGWLYWFVFAVAVIWITTLLLIHDRKLLERRLDGGPAAERESSQEVIQSIAGLVAIAFIIVPGLDHRFGWSKLPPYAIAAGDGLVACGFLVVFHVFRHNSFTAAIITVERDQPVISTGPYAVVRHPMYAGALLIFLGTPLALGSAWGLLLLLPMTGVLFQRMLAEEIYLYRNLAGYTDYCREVRHRIIPFTI